MMGFDYDEAGEFGSEQDAREWAERNGIELADLHIRNRGDRSVTLSVRRSALGESARSDLTYGRRTGFFS